MSIPSTRRIHGNIDGNSGYYMEREHRTRLSFIINKLWYQALVINSVPTRGAWRLHVTEPGHPRACAAVTTHPWRCQIVLSHAKLRHLTIPIDKMFTFTIIDILTSKLCRKRCRRRAKPHDHARHASNRTAVTL